MPDYLPFSDRYTVNTPGAPTTQIQWDFELTEENALSVYRERDGVITKLVLNTDYTLPAGIGDETGGTATLSAASVAGDIYALKGDLNAARPDGYSETGKFSSKILNADNDRIYRLLQEVRRDQSRSLQLAHTNDAAYDAETKRLANIGDAVEDNDAVPKHQMSSLVASDVAAAQAARDGAVSAKDMAVSAGNTAANAATSAGNAATAAANSSGDATSAKNDAVQAKTDAETAKDAAEQAAIDAGMNWRGGGWIDDNNYSKSDALRGTGGAYVSLLDHQSALATEPGVGANWQTHWELFAADALAGSPATEGQAGIAEISNQAEVDAGVDDERFVTPLKLENHYKLKHLLVSQTADIDKLIQDVAALDQAVVLQGGWDASVGTFPGGGTAQAGHAYIVSTAGTVDGVEFDVDDRIIAVTDNASVNTFAGNWHKSDNTDKVLTVAGLAGNITALALVGALGLVIGTDVQAFDPETLKANQDDNLSAGYTATAADDGTMTTGTYMPAPAGGNMRKLVNGGAFQLEAPTAAGDFHLTVKVTNNASAGAITFSGFDKNIGDDLTTTDGDDFLLHITKLDGSTSLYREALQ